MACRASISSPVGTQFYSSRYNLSNVYGDRTPPYSSSMTSSNKYVSPSHRIQSPTRANSFGSERVYSGSLRRRTSSPGQPRPLPPGPGPLDASGRKYGNYDNIQSTYPKYDSRTYTTTKASGPLRADHSTYVGSKYSDPSSKYSSPRKYAEPSKYVSDTTSRPSRLTRTKRTPSISDLSSRVENVQITETSRLFGSNSDLNASPISTPDRGSRSRDVSNLMLNGTPRRSKDLNNETVLPEIRGGQQRSSPDRDETTRKNRRRVSEHASRSNSLSNGYNTDSSTSLSNRGIVGLRNLGNTCFMNSVIQCLSNTRLLRDYCRRDEHKDEVNKTTSNMKGALINAFANLMHSIWKGAPDTHVSPNDFKSQIARFAKRFVGYNQQDAQEFLMYLLEGLHEDVNRVKEKRKNRIYDEDDSKTVSAQEMWKMYLHQNDSKIVDIFVGQLKSSLTCTGCGHVSDTFDPFWDLSLPIKKNYKYVEKAGKVLTCIRSISGVIRSVVLYLGHGYGNDVSLESCFELFTSEEVLDGDEKPMCSKCKKRQKCTKSFSIQRFPKVLIIHLKRFNQDSSYRSKLSTMVNFPLQSLELNQFAAEKNGAPAMYNLFAVSNHSGTPFGGHYTAYTKHPETSTWHHFSDTRVSQISESQVQSSEAYVLFYELVDHSSRL